MRLLPLILVLLFGIAMPAFAQEEEKQDEKPVAAEERKPAVDWVKVESTGTLSDVKGGALEKTLWKGQKRSEIEYLLQKLPETISLRSVLSLQRRLLLSKTDSSLIDNDIGPLRGNDLLIQRINKLMGDRHVDRSFRRPPCRCPDGIRRCRAVLSRRHPHARRAAEGKERRSEESFS